VYICVSKNNYQILNFWCILGPKESSNTCHLMSSFVPAWTTV